MNQFIEIVHEYLVQKSQTIERIDHIRSLTESTVMFMTSHFEWGEG